MLGQRYNKQLFELHYNDGRLPLLQKNIMGVPFMQVQLLYIKQPEVIHLPCNNDQLVNDVQITVVQ